ncbi:unnamed protein product [Lupinus luteus]|uniref:Uncharacterized protein n=1 Tax=Lupinus luteus TaxID=3873 RepID=A0AAV1Y961_LUPLU
MAENLDDGEFWLPPHFLTDDYTPMNNNGAKNVDIFNAKNVDVFDAKSFDVLSTLFPSRLSSPVESMVWSSETESSNDEYHMTDFTRCMTQLDLNLFQNSKVLQTNSALGLYTEQHLLTHQQFQMAHQGLEWGGTNTTTQLKGYSGNYQWGQSNQMVANRVRNIDGGMRAVNLVNPSVPMESIGTGVFLPQRVVNRPVKSKKKSASSNAWVRTRVVQAQDSKQLHHRSNEAQYVDYESAFPKLGSNYGISHQKRNKKHKPPRLNHKIQLPQEWTY